MTPHLPIDISPLLCRNPKTYCQGGLMTDLSIHNIAWGLLASTVTPGSTAPVVSRAMPAMAPVVADCA